MKSLAQRLWYTMAAILVMVLAFGSPAKAAGGSFDWTASMICCIYTREFTSVTTSDVWFDIDSLSPATDAAGNQVKISVTLYRGSDVVGTTRTAVAGGDYVWRGVPKGTYRFRLYVQQPSTNDFTYKLTGSAAYDGRTTLQGRIESGLGPPLGGPNPFRFSKGLR